MAKHTPGPWQRRSIPGHLFELKNAAGDIVLRIRGGMMPTLDDARVLEAAAEMAELLRDQEKDVVLHLSRVRALLARIDGAIPEATS